MSVNLKKGQKVDLRKEDAGLKAVMVGLGWDAAQPVKKGFLGLFSAKPDDIDCDASVIMCAEDGKMKHKKDLVYFGNLRHQSGAVIHQGDNLTGAGEGDDEQILVDLEQLPAEYHKLVFVVNIYQANARNQHFGMIENAFIRLVDANTNKEICKYDLSESCDGDTAMIFAEVYRSGSTWMFNAIGEPTRDNSLTTLVRRYQ